MIGLLVLLAAPALLATSADPDCIDAAGKARLLTSVRDHAVQMRDAERTIRRLNDPRTPTGRKRIAEATRITKAADERARFMADLLARPQPGCRS